MESSSPVASTFGLEFLQNPIIVSLIAIARSTIASAKATPIAISINPVSPTTALMRRRISVFSPQAGAPKRS
jgi:hypothetical protein